jgi:hypothetical protein
VSADLRARIADEVHIARPIHTGCSGCTRIADAVLAVVQPELDAKDAKLPATAILDLQRAIGLPDDPAAEWEDLLDRVKHAVQNAEDALRAALEAEAERDRLRDLLTEALHLHAYGERAPGGGETWRSWWLRTEKTLRAALDQAPAAEQDGGRQ